MAAGPLLATVVHTVAGQDGAGLAGCSDDQLMGIIIEDETKVLSDEDAAKADAGLAEQAPGKTFGELRHAAPWST
jgi:hypothetical protein